MANTIVTIPIIDTALSKPYYLVSIPPAIGPINSPRKFPALNLNIKNYSLTMLMPYLHINWANQDIFQ